MKNPAEFVREADIDAFVKDIFFLWLDQENDTLGPRVMKSILSPFFADPNRQLIVNPEKFSNTWSEITIAASEVLNED